MKALLESFKETMLDTFNKNPLVEIIKVENNSYIVRVKLKVHIIFEELKIESNTNIHINSNYPDYKIWLNSDSEYTTFKEKLIEDGFLVEKVNNDIDHKEEECQEL
jgi:hypothetical protein